LFFPGIQFYVMLFHLDEWSTTLPGQYSFHFGFPDLFFGVEIPVSLPVIREKAKSDDLGRSIAERRRLLALCTYGEATRREVRYDR
jgi:hypothetical protein